MPGTYSQEDISPRTTPKCESSERRDKKKSIRRPVVPASPPVARPRMACSMVRNRRKPTFGKFTWNWCKDLLFRLQLPPSGRSLLLTLSRVDSLALAVLLSLCSTSFVARPTLALPVSCMPLATWLASAVLWLSSSPLRARRRSKHLFLFFARRRVTPASTLAVLPDAYCSLFLSLSLSHVGMFRHSPCPAGGEGNRTNTHIYARLPVRGEREGERRRRRRNSTHACAHRSTAAESFHPPSPLSLAWSTVQWLRHHVPALRVEMHAYSEQ